MTWLLLAILLIVIFGLGTILKAAFWTLLVIAAVVALLVFMAGRLVSD